MTTDAKELTAAEIRATMSSEQILLERKLTCEAINGAMAFGYQDSNPPPSDDHWLAPFWKIGRQQAELEALAALPSDAAQAPWIRVADRLPPRNAAVIVAAEFDGPGDWRMKAGGLSEEGKWTVFGASWTPTHWTPMPAAPNAAPVAPAAAAPLLNAPEGEDPMKHGDRSIEASVERLTEAYCKQQPLPIPDQMALVWRFDIGRLRNDWIRLTAWQKSQLGKPHATQPDERAACTIDGDEIAAIRKASELMCAMGYHADATQITCFLARAGRAPEPQATVKGDERIACPNCGGSQSSWKCTCEPMWEGYVRAAIPQAGALTDEQIIRTAARFGIGPGRGMRFARDLQRISTSAAAGGGTEGGTDATA